MVFSYAFASCPELPAKWVINQFIEMSKCGIDYWRISMCTGVYCVFSIIF
jgi:hypothetical protein